MTKRESKRDDERAGAWRYIAVATLVVSLATASAVTTNVARRSDVTESTLISTQRVLREFKAENSVHRVRNEAAHACIAEMLGGARPRTPDRAVSQFEACVDRVSRSVVPPRDPQDPLRFTEKP